MNKFEKVNNAIMEITRNTSNWVRVTRNVNASHKGKYVLQNVVNGNISNVSYNTLEEIMKEFNLTI